MNILYIKRAYNTRLHTQIQALSERGHSIILLLEAPLEYGYNGPGQWDVREIRSRFPVIYASSGNARAQRPHGTGLIVKVLNRMKGMEQSLSFGRLGSLKDRQYLKTLDQVLSKYRVDLVLSGNDALPDEDHRTRLILDRFGGKVPIVYDCQDILSDCFIGNRHVEESERAVHEKADGVIHTNPLALKWAAIRYRLKRGYAFSNYSNRKYFPNRGPKLSSRDGRIHLVYCGGVQRTPKGYGHPFARDMKKRFMEIASLGHPLHLHLGLYPGSAIRDYYMELEKSPNIRIHPYRSFSEMMQALSLYDVGLFPLDLSSLNDQIEARGLQVLDQSRFSRIDTSKQYEYTLAGLSMLTAPVRWVSDWLRENHFGTSFHSIEDLGNLLRSKEMSGYLDSVRQAASRFSIEHQIGGLERFLVDLSGKCVGGDGGEGR